MVMRHRSGNDNAPIPVPSRPARAHWPLKSAACLCAALAMAGCAAQPQKFAQQSGGHHFDPKKMGVSASPRVVADGEPVPVGGGRYQVGKPYTIAGRTYYPSERSYSAIGTASWYGDDFHGRRTANGEIFDKASITAAHPTMPLPSYARVTNLRNNASIIVRVNDRGPYHGGRVMDVSQRVAEALDFKRFGTARVKVEYVAKAGLGGSDYNKLLATLRTDGGPAALDGGYYPQPTLIAQRPAPAPPVAQRAPAVAANALDETEAPPPALANAPLANAPLPPARPQLAALAANVASDAGPAETSSVVKAETPGKFARAPANAPLPPLRPFDLGTIPGAGVPIAALPAQKQASLATYYDAAPIALADRFVQRGPFEGLKPTQLQPLNSRLD